MLLTKVDNRIHNIKVKANPDLYTPELSFLQDDEIQALHTKLQSIRGDLFTKEVMNTLLVAEDTEQYEQAELSLSSRQGLSEAQKIQIMKLEIERMKAQARLTNATAKVFCK